MKFWAAFLAIVLLCVPLTVFAEEKGVSIAADDEAIVYMGRWTKGKDGKMRGSFECGLTMRFTGTSVRLNGTSGGSALVAIDGGEVKAISLTKNAVLFKGLEDGEHTLEIYAAAQRAFPVIPGFLLDEGASVLPAEKGKIIEFVGDSIMEGYVNPNDAGDFGANSYRNSYGFLTGRRLMQEFGMRFNTIAYGGIRIVERGDNEKNDPMGMPERYFCTREWMSDDGTLAQSRKAAGEWDTTLYSPDYIVINLGTNDRGGDHSRIRAEMYKYLNKLNKTYPDALVFVLQPFLPGVNEDLQMAVTMADNDHNILVDTTPWEIPAGYDNCHPAPAAHEKAAEKLYETLLPYIVDTPDDTTTDEPTDAPTNVPESATDATTDPGSGDGKSFDVVPYAIGGGAALVVAAVAAAVLIQKKKKQS